MRKKFIIDDAQKIINEFLLIKGMQYLSAKKCALICAKKCRENTLSFDSGALYYWDEIVAEIEGL